MRDNPANLMTRSPETTHEVAVVVYDGVGLFELGVVCDIFGSGEPAGGEALWYELSVCSHGDAPVVSDGHVEVRAPFGLDRLGGVRTVIVPPTSKLESVPGEVFEALRQAYARGCRIVSLCTGAFVLAKAGLLDGRPATTHWSECDELVRRHPDVSVDPRVLYVDDGRVLTSAGSAASIDLCLYIVRRDYGAEAATRLARDMVVAPQRDGGQAQFIESPLPTLDSDNLFADTVAWAQEHLNESLTVEDLAARSAMSPRTFARRFLDATGTTPHQWLQRQRVHLAQRLLEGSELSIDVVARHSGFCTAGNLRKHFSRVLHTSPHAYRRTFQERDGRSGRIATRPL